MKKINIRYFYVVAITLLTVVSNRIVAQKVSQQTYLIGHISGLTDTATLSGEIIKNNFQTFREWQEVSAAVDAQGNFKLRLGALSSPERINLSLPFLRLSLAESILVEPGDSVSMNIKVNKTGFKRRTELSFTGRGAEKYELLRELSDAKNEAEETISKSGRKKWDDSQWRITKFDSLYVPQILTLNKYKSKISPQAYRIFNADILGNLSPFFVQWPGQYKIKHPEKYDLATVKGEFEKTEQHLSNYIINNASAIADSKPFLDLLLSINQSDLALVNAGKIYRIGQFIDYIIKKYHIQEKRPSRESYNKLIAENLLTHYFTSLDGRNGGAFIPDIDPDEYQNSLKIAINAVTTPELKAILRNKLKFTKGEPALDFKLPLDTTNKMMSLSDFRGKVVLIDMYSYQCGVCENFATAFHQKVFPMFKNDPRFAYVSIMAGEATIDMYKTRLNNLDDHGKPNLKSMYTSPEYFNLRGCVGRLEIQESKRMQKYYNVFAAPFVMLIDKKGKIYSSTVPFFTEPNDPNAQKFADLITKAINEKD